MGIIIGVLMLTLGVLFLHKIILGIFGLFFGFLIVSLAILVSIVSLTFVMTTMVIVGVLCVIGLIIGILI